MWLLFALSIAILLATMALPLPYDIHWMAKLLRRDVRVLRTKLITSLKRKFKAGEVAGYTSLHQAAETERPKEVTEGVRHIPKPSDHASEGTVYSRAQEDVLEDAPETDGEKYQKTFYELLEGRLKVMYGSRSRDTSHKDRWKFRGSWLLLYKAIQAWRSNDSYDDRLVGARDADEKRMLLELLELSTGQTRSSACEVSKMPSAPYTRHDSNHNRYDSMLSNTTTLALTPSTAQIWWSILEATNDATKIAPMAEKLLHYVSLGEKAVDMIEQMGDPHTKFADADDAELRAKFRVLLCPGFISFTSQR